MKNKKLKPRAIGLSFSLISFIWAVVSFYLGKNTDIKLSTYILIFIIITIIGFFMILIEFKNHQLNTLQQDIKDNIVGLLNSYDRLAKFEKKELYKNLFKQFVSFEKQVIGVQTYNYSLSSSAYKNSIKIHYEDGYIEENHEINAIIQSYYAFQKSDLKKVEKSLKKLIILGNSKNAQDFFFNTLAHANLHSDKVNDEKIALLSLVEEKLTQSLGIQVENGLFDVLKIEKPQLKKRLGIAKAILSYEFFQTSTAYNFKYLGKNKEKSDRRYLTYIVESHTGEKKLYLIVYRIEQFSSDDAILELEQSILYSFKEFLVNNGLVEERIDFNSEWGLDSIAKKFKSNY